MRQKNDQQYADLVANVCVGQLTDEQKKLLLSRLNVNDRCPTVADVCKHYQLLVASGDQPMILLPRSAACTKVNNAMIENMGTEVHVIAAEDTQDTIVH